MILALWFIAACLAVLGLSILTMRRRWDAVILACLLTLSCVGTNLLDAAIFPSPVTRELYPCIDFPLLVLTLWLFWTEPLAWKIALAFALLNKLIAHALFWRPGSLWPAHDYVIACNIIFAEELAIVAVPGGISIGRHILNLADRGGDPYWMGSARRFIENEAARASQITKDR